MYDTDGITRLQATYNEYIAGTQYGTSYLALENLIPINNTVIQTKTTVFDFKSAPATRYITEYSDFNTYNKPALTEEYNCTTNCSVSNLDKKYTRQSVAHATDIWLLNIPTKVEISSDNATWIETSRTSYHENASASHYKLPNQVYQFGKLARTYSQYHPDGNIKKVEYNDVINTITDTTITASATNQYVLYEHYKRGKATTITVPNRYDTGSKSLSLVINDRGEVTQTTDFSHQVINYTYDNLGRLQVINPVDVSEANTVNLLDTVISWSGDYDLVQTTSQ